MLSIHWRKSTTPTTCCRAHSRLNTRLTFMQSLSNICLLFPDIYDCYVLSGPTRYTSVLAVPSTSSDGTISDSGSRSSSRFVARSSATAISQHCKQDGIATRAQRCRHEPRKRRSRKEQKRKCKRSVACLFLVARRWHHSLNVYLVLITRVDECLIHVPPVQMVGLAASVCNSC